MERVNHVDILQIGCRRLIGDVDRMLQRQVPDREGLKLSVSGLDSPPIIVIKLGQAGGQFSAASARSGNHHKRFGNLDVRICPVALVADDGIYIRRIALGKPVFIGPNASALQLVDKSIYCRRVFVSGNDYAVDSQIVFSEGIDQPHNFQIVCNAEIVSGLAGDDIACVYTDDDFRFVLQSLQQLYLGVLIKAGQNPHGMFVVNQLSAEFQIEPFRVAVIDSLQDVLRLLFNIFLRIKTYFVHSSSSSILFICSILCFRRRKDPPGGRSALCRNRANPPPSLYRKLKRIENRCG